MGKKRLVKQELYGNIFDDDFDLESMEGPMAQAMGIMLQASNHQMLIALELTKLIVFKDSSEKDRSEQNQLGEDREERVFSVFKKATKVAAESFASKDLLEQFEQ
jgi:hypothetical protein